MTYRYRHCDRCRREWPAERSQCPECLAWLGAEPLERAEWRLAPGAARPCSATGYENVGVAAFSLRLIGPPPSEQHLTGTASLLSEVLQPVPPGCDILDVTGAGWLLWTDHGPRRVFQGAAVLRDRLNRTLPRLHRVAAFASRLRWGIWVDDCVIPFGSMPTQPCIDAVLAACLFDFEPDDMLLAAETIFRANRRWEHFVGIPARRHGDSNRLGFRPLGRKQPSALDHARIPPHAQLVGRANELAQLDELWHRSRQASRHDAIIAPAGAGKTRLVSSWLDRHRELRALQANFSIFGGDLAAFASQLVALPEGPLNSATLAAHVLERHCVASAWTFWSWTICTGPMPSRGHS